MKKKRNNTHLVAVWLADDEYQRMEADMDAADITTKANYLRQCLFHGRIRVIKKNTIDKSFLAKINDISSQIEKIGVNYNQITKRVNEMMKAPDNAGSAASKARQMGFYMSNLMSNLQELTNEVASLQHQIIEMISIHLPKSQD